jgi:hydroxyacylglutathione hydrolase
MVLPLEDTWRDIIGKAQRGLGINDATLAKKIGFSEKQLHDLKEGEGSFDPTALEKMAVVLNLKASALLALADSGNFPEERHLTGLAQFNTPFDEMTVNNYVVHDPASKKAIVFDSGADASPALDYIKKNKLEVELILLTHSHGDHVLELDRFKERTMAPAYIGDREPLEGAETFPAGKTFTLGSLTIATRLTWGHSQGGISYVIHGLSQQVAIVGDAIFASSMGGGKISYPDALASNRKEIFTLPDSTILCPGHGPITTVGEEKKNNPFFPEF